jgi:hypothetical protein
LDGVGIVHRPVDYWVDKLRAIQGDLEEEREKGSVSGIIAVTGKDIRDITKK